MSIKVIHHVYMSNKLAEQIKDNRLEIIDRYINTGSVLPEKFRRIRCPSEVLSEKGSIEQSIAGRNVVDEVSAHARKSFRECLRGCECDSSCCNVLLNGRKIPEIEILAVVKLGRVKLERRIISYRIIKISKKKGLLYIFACAAYIGC